MNYKEAEKDILKRLENEIPKNYYYHNYKHTLDVLSSAEYYGEQEKLGNEDMILLKTAALFHDAGFLVKYSHSEEASVNIVNNVLPNYDYNPRQIEIINRMILCTEIPQKPRTLPEKVLCDADLDYLGRKDFYMTGLLLFREWNENGIVTSIKEWYVQELYFLQQHEYFTKSAIKLRQELKMFHLNQVKELLDKNV